MVERAVRVRPPYASPRLASSCPTSLTCSADSHLPHRRWTTWISAFNDAGYSCLSIELDHPSGKLEDLESGECITSPCHFALAQGCPAPRACEGNPAVLLAFPSSPLRIRPEHARCTDLRLLTSTKRSRSRRASAHRRSCCGEHADTASQEGRRVQLRAFLPRRDPLCSRKSRRA